MPQEKKAGADIESALAERRLFKPSKKFSATAKIGSLSQYEKLYKTSIKDPAKFFAKQAEELHWFKKWKKIMTWKALFAQWFSGGKINAGYNCVDGDLTSWRRN